MPKREITIMQETTSPDAVTPTTEALRARLRAARTHLQKHEEELPRCKHFLIHQTVRIVLHALSFGQSKQLPGNETKYINLFSIRFQVDTDALAVKIARKI